MGNLCSAVMGTLLLSTSAHCHHRVRTAVANHIIAVDEQLKRGKVTTLPFLPHSSYPLTMLTAIRNKRKALMDKTKAQHHIRHVVEQVRLLHLHKAKTRRYDNTQPPTNDVGAIHHLGFPHIIDAILASADNEVWMWMSFRATSKFYRDRLTPCLVNHLEITAAPKPGRIEVRSHGGRLCSVTTRPTIFPKLYTMPTLFRDTAVLDIHADKVTSRDLRNLAAAWDKTPTILNAVRVLDFPDEGWPSMSPIPAATYVFFMPTILACPADLQPPATLASLIVTPYETRKVVLNVCGQHNLPWAYLHSFIDFFPGLDDLVVNFTEDAGFGSERCTFNCHNIGFIFVGALIARLMNDPKHRDFINVTLVNAKALQRRPNDHLNAKELVTTAVESTMDVVGWDQTVKDNVTKRINYLTSDEYRALVGPRQYAIETQN